MPEQMGRRDNQAASFGVRGFESDERPDVLCSDASASSVSLSFAIPDLFFVIEDGVICNFRVFRPTVGDEQTMLLAMSGFVDRGVAGFLENRGEFLESIDFLCILSDER
jgi:hypothetical protein